MADDSDDLGPGEFRPPPAFVQASLARQAKIKQHQAEREAAISNASAPATSSQFSLQPPKSPPRPIPARRKSINAQFHESGSSMGSLSKSKSRKKEQFTSSSHSPSKYRTHATPTKGLGKKNKGEEVQMELSSKGALNAPVPASQSNTSLADEKTSALSRSLSEMSTGTIPDRTQLNAAYTVPSIQSPSKAVLEIERLKAARESRRALAAEMKRATEGLDDHEKETKVYRDSIDAFRASLALASDIQRKNASLAVYRDTRIKYLLDYTFDETASNAEVYQATVGPLVEGLFDNGMCTFFAYGQTGSGKTHTIFGKNGETGIYEYACRDMISKLHSAENVAKSYKLRVCFFEIYGPRIHDLLARKAKLQLLEDRYGNVQIQGLREVDVYTLEDLLELAAEGNSARTTGSTEANPESSRSHAVFQIKLITSTNNTAGKLSLVDLAGSERGVDAGNVGRKARVEGAEINKSLLALKECIRALHKRDNNSSTTGSTQSVRNSHSSFSQASAAETHIPFRASKLTQILRDSFIGRRSRTVMVATISPGSDSAEHTLNTLRYTDRVKEFKKPTTKKAPQSRRREESVQSHLPSSENDDDDADDFQSEEDEFVDPEIELLTSEEEEEDTVDDGEYGDGSDKDQVIPESIIKAHIQNIELHNQIIQDEKDYVAQLDKINQLGEDDENEELVDNYASRLESFIQRKLQAVAELQGTLGKLRKYATDKQT
ncbi:Kinesin-like protein kif2a [Chytridiales sp. JEL 0842]|nr:Kinesin-like protein kif2a [Chytridiales sp. JEL 0842]